MCTYHFSKFQRHSCDCSKFQFLELLLVRWFFAHSEYVLVVWCLFNKIDTAGRFHIMCRSSIRILLPVANIPFLPFLP